ncbi:hypothetical protein ACFOGG_10985 [Brenneria rubrifaciens]
MERIRLLSALSAVVINILSGLNNVVAAPNSTDKGEGALNIIAWTGQPDGQRGI